MKPQHFFCYFAVVAVLFTACKKDKEDKDFRTKWIGDWNFDVKRSEFHYGNESETTYCYSGEISLGNSPYELQIKYNQSSLLKAYVNEDGSLHVPEIYIHNYSGQFEGNDRMHLHMEGGTLNGTQSWALTIWGTR